MSFHSRTGTLVRLTNGSKTAERTSATNEFNNAIVFSERPLRDNELFEVKIDSKVKMFCYFYYIRSVCVVILRKLSFISLTVVVSSFL